MKNLSLKILILLLAFCIGIFAVFIRFDYQMHKVKIAKNMVEAIESPETNCNQINCFPGLAKLIKNLKKGKSGYFPKNVFAGRYVDSDDFKNNWYGKYLKAAKEQSLLDSNEEDLEIYRLTWLPAFSHAVIVRVEKHKDKYTISIKELDSLPDDGPGKIKSKKTISLDKKDWNTFINLTNETGFWHLPSEIDVGGCEGSQWILESVKDNSYHIVDRWSPKRGKYRDLGLFMMKLSGFDLDKTKDDL